MTGPPFCVSTARTYPTLIGEEGGWLAGIDSRIALGTENTVTINSPFALFQAWLDLAIATLQTLKHLPKARQILVLYCLDVL